MRLVETDEMAAELGLEDVGQEQDRGLEDDPGEMVGRRQRGDEVEKAPDAALKRNQGTDAERRIENDRAAAHAAILADDGFGLGLLFKDHRATPSVQRHHLHATLTEIEAQFAVCK